MDFLYHETNILIETQASEILLCCGKGGVNLTCVPRQDFPGGRGARKKLKVHGKLRVQIQGFPKSSFLK